jgi:hypothetical protein
MARRDIEFDAEGVTLRGWFYSGEGADGPAPKAMMLEQAKARRFAES